MQMSDSRDSDGDGAADVNLSKQPACDTCKTRKIKCDRNSPCSSCVASKITCRTTKRAPEKRQRVLISSRYEHEVAKINEKLDELSKTLATLVQSSKSPAVTKEFVATPTNFVKDVPSTGRSSSRTDPGKPFEGASSFNANSKTITAAFEASFGNQSSSAAAQTVQKLLKDAFTSETSLLDGSIHSMTKAIEFSQLPLPPMNDVLKMLRVSRERPQKFFIEFQEMTIEEFSAICQKLYFPTENYSLAAFTIVNCGLYYLYRFCDPASRQAMNMSEADLHENVKICISNIDAAIQGFRVCLEPSIENIEALMMSISYTMETSKASIAWTLISTAARLCLDAGYHHLAKHTVDAEIKKKKLIFWFIYCLDHGLALNFGRTPTIHDYDITTPRPRAPEDLEGDLALYYLTWIEFAEMQGQVYEKLYSASAQAAPQEVRVSTARMLAARMDKIVEKFTTMDLRNASSPESMRENLWSGEILLHSLRTLIYRIIPPQNARHPLQFCTECVESARKALNVLNEAWLDIEQRDGETWQLFIHWTLLFVPFVPFIVVFGNTVAQTDYNDLGLLERVVGTLQSASLNSPAVEKLKTACSKFHQLASAYLAQVASENEVQNNTWQQNDGTSFAPQANEMQQMQLTEYPFPDIPFSQPDWGGMLDEWDLGIGAENAREMSSFFEQYMARSTNMFPEQTSM